MLLLPGAGTKKDQGMLKQQRVRVAAPVYWHTLRMLRFLTGIQAYQRKWGTEIVSFPMMVNIAKVEN